MPPPYPVPLPRPVPPSASLKANVLLTETTAPVVELYTAPPKASAPFVLLPIVLLVEPPTARFAVSVLLVMWQSPELKRPPPRPFAGGTGGYVIIALMPTARLSENVHAT